jgi:hypothetical protein
MDVEETDENEKPEVAENVEVDKNNKDSEKVNKKDEKTKRFERGNCNY